MIKPKKQKIKNKAVTNAKALDHRYFDSSVSQSSKTQLLRRIQTKGR